jgi:hypothetical protein
MYDDGVWFCGTCITLQPNVEPAFPLDKFCKDHTFSRHYNVDVTIQIPDSAATKLDNVSAQPHFYLWQVVMQRVFPQVIMFN